MKLGTFDLMVARSYAPTFNLRIEWERVREDYPRLNAFFDDDGLPVLNVIALRNSNDVRQRAVLSLDGAIVRDAWHGAAKHMNSALSFVTDEVGVWHPDWIPYRRVLTLLAAASYDDILKKSSQVVKTWYWNTVLGRRYDVASNTKTVADYNKIITDTWESSGVVIVRETAIDASKKQQGSFHRAIITALASNGPRDPLNGERLTPAGLENGRLPSVDAISLFPRSRSDSRPVPLHLRTLGFVLVSETNRRAVAGRSLVDLDGEALETQFIEPEAVDVDEHLLARRLETIVDWVRSEVDLPIQIVNEADAP